MMSNLAFPTLIAVAGGGAVGALARYFMMLMVGHFSIGHFPYGTLSVNVFGAVLMGFLIEVSALVWSPSPEIRAFLVIGFLGSFTTFSAFTLDVFFLYERGSLAPATLYIAASLMLGIGGFLGGMFLGRILFT